MIGAPDADGPMITSAGGSGDGAKQQVSSLVERLVAWVDGWTGPISGAAIVTALVSSLAFAVISAKLLGGDT